MIMVHCCQQIIFVIYMIMVHCCLCLHDHLCIYDQMICKQRQQCTT